MKHNSVVSNNILQEPTFANSSYLYKSYRFNDPQTQVLGPEMDEVRHVDGCYPPL